MVFDLTRFVAKDIKVINREIKIIEELLQEEPESKCKAFFVFQSFQLLKSDSFTTHQGASNHWFNIICLLDTYREGPRCRSSPRGN